VSVTASAVALFPDGGLVQSDIKDFQASYDFNNGGELVLSVGSFALSVGQAVRIEANSILVTPSRQTLVTLGSGLLSSPQFNGLGVAVVSGVEVRRDGFQIGSFSLTQPAGQTAAIGNILTFSGLQLQAANFGVSYGDQTTVSGTVSLSLASVQLFPKATFLTSELTQLSASYDFSNGGALNITVGSFALSVGQALKLAATNIVITPGNQVMAHIGTATVSSPQFSQLGTATVQDFDVKQTGFTFASIQLAVANGGTATLGGFLSLTNLVLQATNFSVVYGDSASTTGTLSVTADQIALFPSGGVVQVTVSGFEAAYDFGQGGELTIDLDDFALSVGEALRVEVSQVSIHPAEQVMVTIAEATMRSPQFPQLGTATLENFELRQNGFSLGSAALTVANGGEARIGSFLSFSNLVLSVVELDVTYGDTTSVDGRVSVTADSIRLFPDGGLITSNLQNFSASYDFTSGGKLRITVGTFGLQIGQALNLGASNVVITPGQQVIASLDSAFVTSPGLANLGTLTLSGLQVRQDGFQLASAQLRQPDGLTASFGSFLSLRGVVITLTNFSFTYGAAAPVSGRIELAADSIQLFPQATFLTSQFGQVTASYDFTGSGGGKLRISIGSFALNVGQALAVTASGVTITPGDAVMATIASASVSSPQFTQLGTATLQNFQLRQDGFGFASLQLAVANGGSATFGNVLRMDNLVIAAQAFNVVNGDNPSTTGTLSVTADTIALFPNGGFVQATVTGFSGSYDFGAGGALKIQLQGLALRVGEALKLDAGDVIIQPQADVMATIGSATLSSPQFPQLGTASLSNFELRRDGFSVGNATLTVANGGEARIGSFLSFQNLVLSAQEFAVNYGDQTTVSGRASITADSIKLFPDGGLVQSNLQNFSAQYDFTDGGRLEVTIGDFELSVGQAVKLTASNVVVTPGQATIATIDSAFLNSPGLSNLGTFSLSGVVVRQDGFHLGTAQYQQPSGVTASFGTFLSLTGVSLSLTDFDVTYGATTQVSGTLAFSATTVSLFPQASFLTSQLSGLTGQFDFSASGGGKLRLTVANFTLSVGEALQVTASGVVITPSDATIATIASATLSSPKFSQLGTASLTNLELRQTGFSLGSASLSMAVGGVATLGGFLGLKNLVVTATNFEVTYGDSAATKGTLTVSADQVTLFPDSTLIQSAFTGVSAIYDFGAGAGSLVITIGTFQLDVGEAVRLNATNVQITPGQTTIAQIQQASVSSPKIANLDPATITNLVIRQDGFSLGSLVLSQKANTTASFGSFLALSGARLSVTDFNYTQGGDPVVTGTIGLNLDSASLFPGNRFLTSDLEQVSGTFDLAGGAGSLNLQIGSFTLMVGSALRLQASNVTVTPGQATIATLQSVTVNSPSLSNLGTVTLDQLAIRQDGFSLASLTIRQAPGKVATIGSLLSFQDVVLQASDLNIVTGDQASVSGTVTLSASKISLLPNATFLTSSVQNFTASFDFSQGAGSLVIHVGNFGLSIGDALQITAAGIDITPGGATLVSIDNAQVTSPLITQLSSGSIDKFVVTSTGFSVGNITLSQASGKTAQIGGVLSFSGLTVQANGLQITYGDNPSVSGTVTVSATSLNLFPGASFISATSQNITGTFAFGQGTGALNITIGQFQLTMGEALTITASNVVLTPGQATIATIASASVNSAAFSGLAPVTLSNLKIRRDGFSLGSLVLQQASGQTATIGSFLSMSGVSVSVNNFSLTVQDSGVTVSGNIQFGADSISLFPGSSVVQSNLKQFTGQYTFAGANAGALVLTIGAFDLTILNALKLTASNVSITPGQTTIATIATATVSSPKFPSLPTTTLSQFAITQTGFTIGAATLAQGTTPVTLGSIFTFTGLSVTAQNLAFTFGAGASVGGALTVAAQSAVLFPGSSLFTASVTGFTGNFDLTSGALSLTANSFQFQFGSTLTVTAQNLAFNPDADVMAQVDSVSMSVPALSITGTATGLQVTKAGQFSIVSATLNTAGLASSLGIANFLPFNVSSLTMTFAGDTNHNGQRDPGEVFKLTEFDLTVNGTFNFSAMQGLPFTPIIRIGPSAGQQSFDDATDPFSFSITVADGKAKPKDIGPIEIGFADLKIGQTMKLGGSIILGGYQNGLWVSSFGGSISLQQTDSVGNVNGAAVTVLGSYDEVAGSINATATLTVSFSLGSYVQVTNAALTFYLILNSTSGGGFNLQQLRLDGAQVQSVTFNLGSLLTLQGTNVLLNFNPAPDDYIASFGSLSATLPGLGIGGTARNIAITPGGTVHALDNFSVSLDLTDSSKLSWPSWLPIQITSVGLSWKDFDNDILDFAITLSASVTSINGLPLQVQGSVEGVVIDIGLLKSGSFPITDITSVGVRIGGSAFGGSVDGGLFLGILKLDASNKIIQPGDTQTAVARRVFYGGLEAGFSLAGTAGFKIQVGLSELGPLQIYMSASFPIILEPISGLAITNFRGGVTFDQTLPAITDPMALRGNQFQPAGQLTFDQWMAQMKQGVVNQVVNGGGTSQWANFGKSMIIQAGATLYSAYASTNAFTADTDLLIDTTGKFVINARMTFGATLSLHGLLYFDLSQVASGSATILFLADLPAETPIETFFGGLQFHFARLDGTPVSATNPADSFQIRIDGGVEYSAVSFAKLRIEGTVIMAFGASQFDLTVSGTVNVSYLGDAIGLAGKLHVDNRGDTVKVWGALALMPNFNKLEKAGLFVDASAVMRINGTGNDLQETLTIPGRGDVTFDLPSASVSVLIDGYILFKLSGTQWFRMQGSFGMEIRPTSLDVFATGTLILGPSIAPLLQFSFQGLIEINGDGVAAKLDLTLATNFPSSFGIVLTASFLLQLNTTGAQVSYTLPPTILGQNMTPPGGASDRTITIAAGPPGTTTGAPYLLIDATGTLQVLTFSLNGNFHFLISPSVFEISADATLNLVVGSTTIFGFHIAGGMRIDSSGIIAAIDLSLSTGLPPSLGFSFNLSVAFRLELNTTGEAATIAGVDLAAGRYALVRITGSLTITAFQFNGYFELTVGDQGLKLQAYATLALVVGSTTLFSFDVRGGFLVSDQGIAAAFALSLGAQLPNLGFQFDVSFSLEVNTTGQAVTLADITIPAGPYARVAAHGSLTVLGFTMQGDFQITMASTYVQIEAVATMQITILGVRLLSFQINGGLQLSDQGLAAVLDLSLAAGVPDSFGFSLEAAFKLQVNTTSQDITLANVLLKAATGTIAFQGSLVISGFSIDGSFSLTVGADLVNFTADAHLRLQVGGVSILSFAVTGGFQVDQYGIAATLAINLDAGGGFPSGYGVSFTATFRLDVNTTNQARTFADVTLEAGRYARVSADGSLNVLGFSLSGHFMIYVGTDGFLMEGTITLDLWGATVSATVDFGLLSDGLAARLLLSISTMQNSIFSLNGTFTLELNTSAHTVFNIQPYTARVSIEQARLTIIGITLSGTVRIGVTNGQFAIDVPSSDPLTLDFFGIVTIQLYGYIHQDGNFSITGSVSLTFGRSDLAAITGQLSVTVSNSGFSGSLFGNVVIFQQRVLTVNGVLTLNSSGFRLVASADLTLPSPLDALKLSAQFDISVSSSGIAASISASVNLWGFLYGSVGGYVDTGSGSWFLHGSAGFSVGGDNLGANGYVNIDVGYLTSSQTLFGTFQTAGAHFALTAGGSAWAGFSIAGYWVGVSASLSGTVDLANASVSITVSGSISLLVTSISWSKTITIEFSNGLHIYLSDVAGEIVYLDINHNDKLDPNEPWGVADAQGKFTFNPPNTPVDVGAAAPTPFDTLDSDNDGVIQTNEGAFLLVGGTVRATGQPNTATVSLGEGQLVGVTGFAGATVFVDANDNGALDASEYQTTTKADGSYSLLPVLFPVQVGDPVKLLGRLKDADTNHNGALDPDEGQMVLTGGQTIATGQPNTATVTLPTNLPTDMTGFAGATVYFDANKNLALDAGEISTTTSSEGRFSFLTTVELPPASLLGRLAPFDTNHNGVLETSEGQLYAVGGTLVSTEQPATLTALDNSQLSGYSPAAGATSVFFDVNGNQQLDANEVSVTPTAKNYYTFLDIAGTQGSLGVLDPFDTDHDGRIDHGEGTFKVVGGVDRNAGVANVQGLAADPSGYGSGLRHTSNALAHLHSELVKAGKTEDEADALLETAFGLPRYSDIRRLDPNVEQAQGTGVQHQVLGAAASVSELILNGAATLQGAGRGRISNTDAQNAMNAALVARIAKLTAVEPKVHPTTKRLVGDTPLLDLSDPGTVSTLIADAATRLGLAAPGGGAHVGAQDAGAPPSLSPERLSAASQVVSTQVGYVNQLAGEQLDNIKVALAKVKVLTQEYSSRLLQDMTRGDRSTAEVLDQLELGDMKAYMDGLNLPSGNSPPRVSDIPNDTLLPGRTAVYQFTVNDPDELSSDLKFTIETSNPAVVPLSGIHLSGAGKNRVLTVTASPDVVGTTHIRVHVSDDRAATVEELDVSTVLGVAQWASGGTHGSGVGEVFVPLGVDGRFSESRQSGLQVLRLTFNDAIDAATFTASNLRIVGFDAATRAAADLGGLSWTMTLSGDGRSGLIQFSQRLPDFALYRLALSGVRAVNGASFVAPAELVVGALAGDANGDLRVDVLDVSAVRSQRTTGALDPASLGQTRSDVNLDGVVDALDRALVTGLRGHNLDHLVELLPPILPPPAPPASEGDPGRPPAGSTPIP
jgi:hypothetical protein